METASRAPKKVLARITTLNNGVRCVASTDASAETQSAMAAVSDVNRKIRALKAIENYAEKRADLKYHVLKDLLTNAPKFAAKTRAKWLAALEAMNSLTENSATITKKRAGEIEKEIRRALVSAYTPAALKKVETETTNKHKNAA